MAQREALDRWVAVGTSSGLAVQSVQRARIGDHDLAIWRGSDGAVRAWENRCPHRGMRLSFGFVRANRLTCLYHGWTYDGEGSCAVIPAHPRLTPPKTIAVGRYACIEHAALIWVASPDAALTPPQVDGAWKACRSLKVDAPPAAVLRLLTATAALPLAEAGDVAAAASQPWCDVVRIDSVDGSRSLLCAVQPVGDGEAMLHIACAGADADSPAMLRRCSDWARRLRRAIEADAAAVPTAALAGSTQAERRLEAFAT